MPSDFIIITAAGLVAGAINAIAGGGTLISFPALLWLGRDPIAANATNTVALIPGSFAGMIGFRQEMRLAKRWLFLLTIPSLAGGIIGAMLLLRTPQSTFERIVPLLIAVATLLLATQEMITSRFRHFAEVHEKQPARGWIAAAFIFQFFVGIYGGYFGAGMGILMLAALGLIGLTDLHQMNGLKNLLAVCINGVAALQFIAAGAVLWREALIMAAGSIVGAMIGARLARRMGRGFVRGAVVAIGVVMTIALLVR